MYVDTIYSGTQKYVPRYSRVVSLHLCYVALKYNIVKSTSYRTPYMRTVPAPPAFVELPCSPCRAPCCPFCLTKSVLTLPDHRPKYKISYFEVYKKNENKINAVTFFQAPS